MEQEAPIIPQAESLNVNYVVATFNNPPRGYTFDKRSPYPFNEEMLACRLPMVENCYTIQGDEFRLKFLMNGVLAKAAIKIQHQGKFTVELDNQPFVVYGMNFAGKLRLNHASGVRRMIFLPGYLTYDPSGISEHPRGHEFLTLESSLFLHSLVASQVKSAQEGAPEQFMDTLHRVHMEADSLYINHPHLMAWMTEQVIFACYPKQGGPQRYRHFPDFILDKAKRDEIKLNEKGRGHMKEYLEWYLRVKEGKAILRQVRPPYQYYLALRNCFKPDELRAIAKGKYDNVLAAADQLEQGQGVFLWYLPRALDMLAASSQPVEVVGSERVILNFSEVSEKCQIELDDYRTIMTQVSQDIITEVALLKQSERTREKCSVF